MSVLKPLRDGILFQFLNETTAGQFVNKNKGRIIIANPEIDIQGKYARWVKVIAVGDDVKTCSVDDVVLVHPGKWTLGFTFEEDGKEQKFWKTDDEWVMANGDESMAYDYAVKE